MATSAVREGGSWVVRIADGEKRMLEYRYGSERQARFMAAIFDLSPARLPVPDAIWAMRPEKKSPARKPHRKNRAVTSPPGPSASQSAAQALRQALRLSTLDEEITLVDEALREFDFEDISLGLEAHAQSA